jgi:hypothetical protein
VLAADDEDEVDGGGDQHEVLGDPRVGMLTPQQLLDAENERRPGSHAICRLSCDPDWARA